MLTQLPGFLKRKVVFQEATMKNSSITTLSSSYTLKKVKSNISNNKEQTSLDNTDDPSFFLSTETVINLNSWDASTLTSTIPGLVNLGNTCFLNSVLQCIVHTPVLAQFLLQGNHNKKCGGAYIPGYPEFCTMCAMEEHVEKCFHCKEAKSPALKPIAFVARLKSIAKGMRPGRQEDAHEFLRYLLDAMHRDSWRIFPDACNSKQQRSNMVDKGPLQSMFSGKLRSRITCSGCGNVSDCIDSFQDLALDIRHSDSIVKALGQFTITEYLCGANRYRCSTCSRLTDAEKRMTIQVLPEVLTLQLKRFTGLDGGKINKHVTFAETLDLDPFCSSTEIIKRPLYELYAVLVHEGYSCHSGHYHCFVKGPSGVWASMNDQTISTVGVKTVLKQSAYILFYRRLPVIKNEQIKGNSKKKQNQSTSPSPFLTSPPLYPRATGAWYVRRISH